MDSSLLDSSNSDFHSSSSPVSRASSLPSHSFNDQISDRAELTYAPSDMRSSSPSQVLHYQPHFTPSSIRSTYPMPSYTHQAVGGSYQSPDMNLTTPAASAAHSFQRHADHEYSQSSHWSSLLPQQHAQHQQQYAEPYTISSDSLSPSPAPFDGAMLDLTPKGDKLLDSYSTSYVPSYADHHHHPHDPSTPSSASADLASQALRQYYAQYLPQHTQYADRPGPEGGDSGAMPRFVNMSQVSPAAQAPQLPDVCDPRVAFSDLPQGSARSDSASGSGTGSPSSSPTPVPHRASSSSARSRSATRGRARADSLASVASSGDGWESDQEPAGDDDGEYLPKRRSLRSAAATPYQRQRAYSSSSTVSSMAEMLVPEEPLMKKTRGRRVPTKDEVIAGGLTQVSMDENARRWLDCADVDLVFSAYTCVWFRVADGASAAAST